MALNINDPVVHEMVKEIARITGESQAQAVRPRYRSDWPTCRKTTSPPGY